MNPAAEGREHADAPVAELVAGALHEDGAVVRDDAGGSGLVRQVAHQVLGGLPVEIVMGDQALDCGCRRHVPQAADHLTDLPAELERPARLVRLPERHLARLPRRGRDGDPIVGDFLDAPAQAPKRNVSPTRLSRPSPRQARRRARGGPRSPSREHAVQPAVGDRAAVDDGARALARR
jgi:hypothetical protein